MQSWSEGPRGNNPRVSKNVKRRGGVSLLSAATVAAVGVALIAAPAAAQETLGRSLTLDEALDVALRNNPGLQVVRNDIDVANWNVRSAYGSWLPGANVSTGFSWQGAGDEQFGSLSAAQLGVSNQPSVYLSNYSLGLTYSLNGRMLMAPGQAKRSRDATGAQIDNAEANLRQTVTRAYLEALRQQEGVRLAEQQLERAEINHRLAEGRRELGSGNAIDAQQAEVTVGRRQVGVLRAQSGLRTSRIILLQNLGVDLAQDPVLETNFTVSEPTWERSQLYRMALDGNPALKSLRATEEVAKYGVRMAKSAYLPSLNFNGRWSGFSRQQSNTLGQEARVVEGGRAQQRQCESLNVLVSRLADPLPIQDCTEFLVPNSVLDAIRSQNDQFPFNFSPQPATAGVTISLPIFQGLGRQREVETARAQRSDARFRVREQELALQANIAARLGILETAYASALIEERNEDLTNEQLRLAQERYRLGLTSFLELVEAETLKAEADRERIAAIFAYHDAVADLEAVVGTPLRNR